MRHTVRTLLDNPDKLKEMVLKSGAYSTQPMDTEPVEVLTDKCREISGKWAKTADELWAASGKE